MATIDENAADDALRLIEELDLHPCVAFAVRFDGGYRFSPTLDIAVRMLCTLNYGEVIDDGRLIWGLPPDQQTPEASATGVRMACDCVSALKRSGEPFTLIMHVHGQRELQLHHGPDHTWESAIQALQRALAEQVRYMI